MAFDRYSNRIMLVGGMVCGKKSDSPSTIRGIKAASVSINPASIGAATRVATTFTITGAAVGDFLQMNPPATLNDDLLYVGCRVTGANQGTVYIYNPTGGAIDDGALTWDYIWTKLIA